MLESILQRIRQLSPEWRFHALFSLGLLVYLTMTANLDLSDPLLYDQTVSWKPYQSAPEGMSLEGPWETDGGSFSTQEKECTLVFESTPGPWRRAEFVLNGPQNADWLVRFRRNFQSVSLPGVKAGDSLILDSELLESMAFSREPVRVEVKPASIPDEGASLDRVMVRLSAAGENKPGSLPGVVFGPLLPIALALFLSRAGRRSFRQATVIGGLVTVLLVAFRNQLPQAMNYMALATVCFFTGAASAAAFNLLMGKDQTEDKRRQSAFAAEWCAILAVVGLAIWTRWEQFLDLRMLPLLPDANGYLEIARVGSFYETSQSFAPYIREPLFPALMRFWYLFTPESGNSGRVAALLIGILPVVLCWLAGRKLFSPAVGVLAATMMAANPHLARLSVEVLKDDLLSAGFLSAICVALYIGQRPWWRAGGFGISGAALALTRINNLFLMPMLYMIEAWRHRWKPMELLLLIPLLLLPVIPHLLYNASVSDGDYLHSSTVHTRYYLNRAHIGEAGFPATLADWEADPYAGNPVSAGALLTDVAPPAVLWRLARGYVDIFAYRFPHGFLFFGSELLMLFGLIGAWRLWELRRDMWWVLAWFVIFLFPVALITPIHLDYRLAAPAAPLILWAWASGVEWVAVELYSFVKRKNQSPTAS